MRSIQMTELGIGDVFSVSIHPRKREALTVTAISDKMVTCSARGRISPVSKRISGSVFLIRGAK